MLLCRIIDIITFFIYNMTELQLIKLQDKKISNLEKKIISLKKQNKKILWELNEIWCAMNHLPNTFIEK